VEDVGDVEKRKVERTRSFRSNRERTSARLSTEMSSMPAWVFGSEARVRFGMGFMVEIWFEYGFFEQFMSKNGTCEEGEGVVEEQVEMKVQTEMISGALYTADDGVEG
jgi:hypothetical protein